MDADTNRSTSKSTMQQSNNLNLTCECIPLSHPPSPIYVCVCVSQIKKDIQCCRVIPHRYDVILRRDLLLTHDTNCCMQFWCQHVSVFPYLISLPPYMCVCVCFSNKKRYSVLLSHPTLVRCDIENGLSLAPRH